MSAFNAKLLKAPILKQALLYEAATNEPFAVPLISDEYVTLGRTSQISFADVWYGAAIPAAAGITVATATTVFPDIISRALGFVAPPLTVGRFLWTAGALSLIVLPVVLHSIKNEHMNVKALITLRHRPLKGCQGLGLGDLNAESLAKRPDVKPVYLRDIIANACAANNLTP